MKSLRLRVVGVRGRGRTKITCESMFHQFSTWWRALSVVLLCLATVTWPPAAQAATTPSFTLLHQDSVAALSPRGTTHFSLTIATSPRGAPSRARVTLYPRVLDRSQLAPIVSGAGSPSKAIATTSLFNLKCQSHGAYSFTIDLYTKRAGPLARPCERAAPHMHLPCAAQSCDGVYPLRLAILTNGATEVKWSLLVIKATRVVQPLRVDLIETMDPSALFHRSRAIKVLDALSRHQNAALTLSADYRTLDTIGQTGTRNTNFRAALTSALTSPLHQAVNAPPSNIDFGGLAAHGFSTEVGRQLSLSSTLLKDFTGRYVDSPLLLSGSQSVANLAALQRSGVSEVVLPENDLSVPPSMTLNWGAPFHLFGTGSLRALSTDDPLSGLMANSLIGSGRRAALTLGILAFLHFEAPNATSIRTVVLVAPIAETPAPFIDDLLNGFAHDPFLSLVTLAPSYDSTLIGSNGAPATRSLSSPVTASHWSTRNDVTLRALTSNVTSFSSAITTSNIGNDLLAATAAAEITGRPNVRQSAINAASNSLASELGGFSVDPSTITLAGPGTSMPITILSRTNYSVNAVIHLLTDRIVFPHGNRIAVTIDSPTKSVRIETSSRSGSSLTLQVVVTTPDNRVVLARAAIQVRIAGTSIVGYFLSITSLLVLAYWWLRTYRQRSKGRHAR